MGRYGMLVRTSATVLLVPGVMFVYVVWTEERPLLTGPLLWTGVIVGLIAGLVGSSLESYGKYPGTAGGRFVFWAIIPAAVGYLARWFDPFWPLTPFGAIIMGPVVGLVQSTLSPRLVRH